MRKLILFVLLTLYTSLSFGMDVNNIFVVRVGDGVTALSSAGARVSILEFDVNGVLINTHNLATTWSGVNKPLVLSGTATSEGFLSLDPDIFQLTMVGYVAVPGTPSVANTTQRVVLFVGTTEDFQTRTVFNGTGTVRSACYWGNNVWVGTSIGVFHNLRNADSTTTPTTIVTQNSRVVNVFNGLSPQLYVSSASGAFNGINAVGTGLPTSSATLTLITSGGFAAKSHYGFTIKGNILYAADDGSFANGGGVRKYTSAADWTPPYNYSYDLRKWTSATRGVITIPGSGIGSDTNNIAFVIRQDTLYKVIDTDSTAVYTFLAAAGANYAFRGIANGPQDLTPVELSAFTSSVIKNNVKLNWSTENEQNNSGFEIEKKSANTGWIKTGFLTGNGTTNTTQHYSFEDKNLSTGNYKYRLKQIDFNGNFEYYDLSNEVIIGVPVKFDLSQNYPNPFNPATSINYELPITNYVTLSVYDINGREVTKLVNTMQTAGYYSVNFNGVNLASGMYFYVLKTGEFTATKKMMLMK